METSLLIGRYMTDPSLLANTFNENCIHFAKNATGILLVK